MEAKAIVRDVRISPRKVSIVLDLIRGKNVAVAQGIIKNTPKAACEPIAKLLASAVANAENNFSMNKDTLYVSQCFVCPGRTNKRMRARAQGRGDRILKRTCHITIAVAEKE